MITARVKKNQDNRISQCDIFKDIEIIEEIDFNKKDEINVHKIHFPLVIVLNQDCDLCRCYENRNSDNNRNKNNGLIHIIVAPVFILDSFIEGMHWGKIFDNAEPIKRSKTPFKYLTDNQDDRFHCLSFASEDHLPDMVIDFKHFFTLSANTMYSMLEKGNRLCSIDDLFKEKISQRFANYISRIGLPS